MQTSSVLPEEEKGKSKVLLSVVADFATTEHGKGEKRRATDWDNPNRWLFRGEYRTRTDDPLRARQML